MAIYKIKTKQGEKWHADFRVSGRNSKRIIRRFDRKIDAQNFLDNFQSEQKLFSNLTSVKVDPESIVFEAEADYWLESNIYRFSAGHLKRVRGILKILLPRFRKLSLAKITAQYLTDLQREWISLNYSPASVNRMSEVVLAILNHSVRNRRFPFNPAAGFRKLPPIGIEMNFWERWEAESFLQFTAKKYPLTCEKRWIHVVYLLAINTGLRAGEIWGLRVCDLVEDGKTLFIRRQFNRVTKDFDLVKGKKNAKGGKISRHVPCNQELRHEMQNLIQLGYLTSENTLFKSQTGRPICHDNFHKRFLKDLKEWGGRKIRFHDMRHTATTLLIAAGVDLKTVQEICGHEDIKTTMNYVHLVGENIRRVSEVFQVSAKPVSPQFSVMEGGQK